MPGVIIICCTGAGGGWSPETRTLRGRKMEERNMLGEASNEQTT